MVRLGSDAIVTSPLGLCSVLVIYVFFVLLYLPVICTINIGQFWTSGLVVLTFFCGNIPDTSFWPKEILRVSDPNNKEKLLRIRKHRGKCVGVRSSQREHINHTFPISCLQMSNLWIIRWTTDLLPKGHMGQQYSVFHRHGSPQLSPGGVSFMTSNKWCNPGNIYVQLNILSYYLPW